MIIIQKSTSCQTVNTILATLIQIEKTRNDFEQIDK